MHGHGLSSGSPSAQRPGASPLESLIPGDFAEPSDEGLSLDELGQAYAALLARGADPYPEGDAVSGSPAETTEPAQPPSVDSCVEPVAAADVRFAVTPRTILEAVLFVGHPTGEPLTSERIAALMRGVRPAEIDELVRDLNEEYAALGSPYTIVAVGAGYQMTLRPQFASLRDAFLGRVREARLSQAAIDVLAIVAYHQPIATDQIDRLRGRPSGAILSQLVRRDLLSASRDPENRSKMQYRTTERFLALFGLERLEELPRSHDLEREL